MGGFFRKYSIAFCLEVLHKRYSPLVSQCLVTNQWLKFKVSYNVLKYEAAFWNFFTSALLKVYNEIKWFAVSPVARSVIKLELYFYDTYHTLKFVNNISSKSNVESVDTVTLRNVTLLIIFHSIEILNVFNEVSNNVTEELNKLNGN